MHIHVALVGFSSLRFPEAKMRLMLFLFGGAPLAWLRLRRPSEMLLVSLLPHYNLLCVLCKWLMMIMQMLGWRAARVIITAEIEPFGEILSCKEKPGTHERVRVTCFSSMAISDPVSPEDFPGFQSALVDSGSPRLSGCFVVG